MVGGIYLIFCRVTRKVYVGRAVDIDVRWTGHRGMLRRGCHHSPHLQHAWDKYGPESFKFSVLEKVSEEKDLPIREQYWMDKLHAYDREFGYNVSKRADNGPGQFSDETIEKMSQAQIHQSDEIRAKRSEAAKNREFHGHTGCKHSEESRQKMSESAKANMTDERKQYLSTLRKGIKHTPETLEKMSEAHTGFQHTEESKEKIRQAKLGIERPEEVKEKLRALRLGTKHSEETKAKISEAGKGRKLSQEHIEIISKTHKGKTISEEQKKKMSEARLGKKMPEEQRQKMLGRKLTPESIAKREATRKKNKELKLQLEQEQQTQNKE